ncbi:MAG: hypothetical protein ACUVX1_07805 [Chloroflexota bacterium]
MNSSLIGKIEKARRYAQELHRVKITGLEADFQGEHSAHRVTFGDGEWCCDCEFFSKWNTCSHTMAMERIMGNMMAQGDEESTLRSCPSIGRTCASNR